MSFRETLRDSLIMPDGYDEPDMPADGSQTPLGIGLMVAASLVSIAALIVMIWGR